MRVLFAGPSLAGASPDLAGITLRPPAAHGDVARAVLDGAEAIGLVDGLFDAVAAVWHKEILFALSQGVAVLGASSMGALRAAECQAFGMRPIGAIALGYCDGSRDDDADVALVHAPAELGYLPLTEPMVEVEATLGVLCRLGHLRQDDCTRILTWSRAIHFADRTLERLVPPDSGLDTQRITALYERHRVRLKQADALLLLKELRGFQAPLQRPAFDFRSSPMWKKRIDALRTSET